MRMVNSRKDESRRNFDLFKPSLKSHCAIVCDCACVCQDTTLPSLPSPHAGRAVVCALRDLLWQRGGMVVGSPSPAPAAAPPGASLTLPLSRPPHHPLRWWTTGGYFAGLCRVLSHMAESAPPPLSLFCTLAIRIPERD